MDYSTPYFPVLSCLLELAQTCSLNESVMPSNQLILCCPLLLLQHQGQLYVSLSIQCLCLGHNIWHTKEVLKTWFRPLRSFHFTSNRNSRNVQTESEVTPLSFPGGSVGRNPATIPGLGRYSGEENGNPLQCP